MKSEWLKLIEEWQDRHHLGLTIPFLIGALRQSPGRPFHANTNGLEQLRTLLTSLRNDVPDGVRARLYTCDRLHELVVLIEPAHDITGSERLCVERGIVQDGDPDEALVIELWRRYGEVIESGNYSLRRGTFQPFSDEDLALVRSAAARLDEDDP
jgi:hypothetical protein